MRPSRQIGPVGRVYGADRAGDTPKQTIQAPPDSPQEEIMSNYTYGSLPFTTTTFTAPVAGSSDVITANAAANFTINGNGGNDTITTGSGNDTITTGNGNDVIRAGDGNNTVSAGDGTNSVTSGAGNDTITTGSGNDVIAAGNGDNIVNAGSGTNSVTTGSGADTITTGSGADTINSGAGNDIINAGAGNDTITPGAGIDAMIGGGGHDTFVYGSLADARLGADTISDFSTASFTGAGEGDRLNLHGLIHDFSGVRTGESLAQLVADGHLHFSAGGGGTVISFDSNGSAAGGTAGVLATLVGVPFATESASVSAFADNILV
jgi:Ca2+-binding RTX toxin-like protein